jgi:hypothetical protein
MHEEKDLVTGVVYTKRIQREIIPAGVDGPLGDVIITSGLIYATKNLTGKPIGKYDINQLVTSVGEDSERRQFTAELSFNRKYARDSWISRLDPPFKKAKQASEINLTGVETFPLGGGLTRQPITLGVTTGTGSFVGAEGTVSIAPVPGTDQFFYTFTLV